MNLVLTIILVGLAFACVVLILLRILNTDKKNDNEALTHNVVDDDKMKSDIHTQSDDDSELVAVLTAAVLAAVGGGSESSIRVKSYRRIPQTSPVWNVISRKDQLTAKL